MLRASCKDTSQQIIDLCDSSLYSLYCPKIVRRTESTDSLQPRLNAELDTTT